MEFERSAEIPALEEFFGFRDSLAQVLGRPVDLVEVGAVKNPYILASINRSKEFVYGA